MSAPKTPGSRPGAGPTDRPTTATWTFLTNHGHVLLAVARSPDARVEDLARGVGITPRATLSILRDLETGGYVRRSRVGRRTHYAVNRHGRFRHTAMADHEVGELLEIFTDPSPGET